MLHCFFLCLGGDHLFVAGGFGGCFALDLVGLRFQFGLLHLLALQVQRVFHLFRFQFFGQQFFHALPVLVRQIDLAHQHAAQQDAVAGQFRFQLVFNLLLDVAALGRENFAHRIAGKGLVDHTLHCRLDDFAIDIGRQLLRHRAQFAGVERVADGQVDSQRQAFDRLERRFAVGLGAAGRAIDLVEQRVAAQFVQAGDDHGQAVAHFGRVAGQFVGADADFAAFQRFERRMRVQAIAGGSGHAQRQDQHPGAAHDSGSAADQAADGGHGFGQQRKQALRQYFKFLTHDSSLGWHFVQVGGRRAVGVWVAAHCREMNLAPQCAEVSMQRQGQKRHSPARRYSAAVTVR